MKKKFYEYMYYRIYNSQKRMFGKSTDPKITAIAILTQTTMFYLLGIFAFITHRILGFDFKFQIIENPGFVLLLLVALFFYIKYARKSKHDVIIKKYSGETQKEKNIWFFIISAYVLFSFIAPIFFMWAWDKIFG